MKLIMVAAVSKDGFLTKGDDPHPENWTSAEDKLFFKIIRAEHELYVMGSRTYELNDVQPNDSVLRVVLTKNPEKYADKSVIGQLEFRDISPISFVEEYGKKFKSCLVLGGSHVYTEFMEAGIVDEVFLTVEPLVHNSGVPLFSNGKTISDYKLELSEEKTLNSAGTRLLHFVSTGN